MSTERSPWYRASKGAWYVTYQGRQVRLVRGEHNRDAAMKAFYQLMAEGVALKADGSILVVQIADLFLSWSERHHTPSTFQWHKTFLKKFCDHKGTGRLKVADLKPYHLTRFLDDNATWTGSRRSVVQIVKRVFSWGEQEGLIEQSPIRKYKIPAGNTRDRVLTEAEQQEIFEAVPDKPFRNFLTALKESGCRPSEVARVTADHVDLKLGIWRYDRHKTRHKTNKPRIIYLSPRLLELTAELVAKHPNGPLFPNKKGEAYSKNAVVCRFRRLREKLPHLGKFFGYLYRHSYCTDALERGVDVAHVSELLGHTSTTMVMTRYSKLSQRVEHLRSMAAKAVGNGTG